LPSWFRAHSGAAAIADDRYDPLPGLLQVPGFLYRKLGPRGRVAAKVGGALLLVAAVVLAIVLVPRIADTKRERAEREEREAAAAMAERRRRLIAEQRPQRARAAPGLPRSAVVTELERRVLADARERVEAGTLRPPPAKRVDCEPLSDSEHPSGPRVGFACLAVTSDIPETEANAAGRLGHPFRAVVDFPSGRLTWCKVSGRPGEGSATRRALVRLPRACSP
jgi:hypothetical protein